jgi:large subunit ribosomal protein L20
MARVKKALNAKKKHKKILRSAKGYYGAKSKLYRPANEAVMRALRSAYVGRKQKKRDMRKLWVVRINAAARLNDISYSHASSTASSWQKSKSIARCSPIWQ